MEDSAGPPNLLARDMNIFPGSVVTPREPAAYRVHEEELYVAYDFLRQVFIFCVARELYQPSEFRRPIHVSYLQTICQC